MATALALPRLRTSCSGEALRSPMARSSMSAVTVSNLNPYSDASSSMMAFLE